MEYNFREIEKKWQEYWIANGVYKVKENKDKPKYYVLDMFPYPSGAGLHVGHPLGYIASDIYSRFKQEQQMFLGSEPIPQLYKITHRYTVYS